MRSKEEIMEEIKELSKRDYILSADSEKEAYFDGFLDALEWVMEIGCAEV